MITLDHAYHQKFEEGWLLTIPSLTFQPFTAPEADDVIVNFMGPSFPNKMDTQLKRVQSAVLASAAPMLNLWEQLEEHQNKVD